MKNRKPYLATLLEGSSTGGDHFRHVVGFVAVLHNTLTQGVENPIVNYDGRERFAITHDNFETHANTVVSMVHTLKQMHPDTLLTIASEVYTMVSAVSSLERELMSVLEHEQSHLAYFAGSQLLEKNEDMPYTISPSHHARNLQLDDLLIQHLNDSISKYQYIAERAQLPITIVSAYTTMMQRHQQLTNFDQDYILMMQDTMITSVSNEYYKLEEALMHILYDIRIFLKTNNISLYQAVIAQDAQFGVAHSTRAYLLQ